MQLTAVLAVAYTTEHADQHLLSAMFLAIGRALNISVARLGTLSMWRALVQVQSCTCSGARRFSAQ